MVLAFGMCLRYTAAQKRRRPMIKVFNVISDTNIGGAGKCL